MPTLTATPSFALQPTPVAIRGEGFDPGERITLQSTLTDDAGVRWCAHGVFVADAHGMIDLATAPSEEGSFTGVDPSGLLWSMQPPGGTDRRFMIDATERAHKLGQPHLDPIKPIVVELQALAGSALRARTTLTLERLVEGIDLLPLRDGRLRGMVFRWRDRSRPRGAIVSLTGSGGGVEMGFAPVLASLGYDVVSLAYFAYEDLPTTIAATPLEYFEEGFEWIRRELGAQRIAVQGASRGGELTLVLASYLPEHLSGALAIVPMYASSAGWDAEKGVAGPSWTFRGQEVPYAASRNLPSLAQMKAEGESLPLGCALTPYYRADLDQPEVREQAALPVERFKGRLLMISGQDDQMWPCQWGADRVVNRLRARGHPHPFQHLALPETGHWTPLPNQVTTFTPAVFHSLANVFLACGGNPAATARTSRLTWDAMVAHYAAIFRSS